DPLGHDPEGKPVFLRDVWPTPAEIEAARRTVEARLYREEYARVTEGGERWRTLPVPAGELYPRGPAPHPLQAPAALPRPPPPPWGPRRRPRATCGAPACSRSSATASPPITSRPPARSRRTARPGGT